MTDTKLLRHSLDSAAPLKPQPRRVLERQVSGSPGPGTAHSVRAQGMTPSGLYPTPKVPLPAPFLGLASYLSDEQPQRRCQRDFETPRLSLRFGLPAGPESAPVTYTPKSGPPALGDPQPGGGSCAASRLTLASHPPKSEGEGGWWSTCLCPKAPPLFTVIKLRDSRPRTQEDSNSPPLQVGNSLAAGATPVLSSPLRGAAPGTLQPGVPAKCPNFPAGPAVTRALPARQAAWRRSHRAEHGRQAGARGVRFLASAGLDFAGTTAAIARLSPSTPARRRPGGHLVSCPQPTSVRPPAPSTRTLSSPGPPLRSPGPLPPLSAQRGAEAAAPNRAEGDAGARPPPAAAARPQAGPSPGAAGLPGVDGGGPGSREVRRDDSTREPRSAALRAPSSGLGWPVTAPAAERVCLCVCEGVAAGGARGAAAPSPGHTLSSGRRLPAGGKSGWGRQWLVALSPWPLAARRRRENGTPNARNPPSTTSHVLPKSGPELAPRPQVQSPAAGGGTGWGPRTGGGSEKFLFLLPCRPPSEAAPLHLSRVCGAFAPPPTWGGGAPRKDRWLRVGACGEIGEERRPRPVPSL
ncbi:uncharacterized protein LOC114225581 [Eumetopias jubatus]|uniref:uncharacterized protein LOC114225581 n=1 Tax=Eumetopias jubatus TaxID=34886 RepID=UPI0010169B3F|nr:uncharacterized protein LOC114225581 [Eumetopias jubatus]